MTIFVFLASDEKGDQGLVITNDGALFVKAPYVTKTIWFVVFPWERSIEPEGKTRFFLWGICLHDANPGPRHMNELQLVLQILTNHHQVLISRKQQSAGLGRA